MGLLDRLRSWNRGATGTSSVVEIIDDLDLPLHARREVVAAQIEARVQERRQQQEALTFPLGTQIDADDYLYRRLTGDVKNLRRDLSPMAQDQMIETSNYLWEQNALARRLVTLMSDLILGEGISVEAVDERNQEVINRTWNHRVNQLATRVRQFYNALSINGELALPVAVNPISGIPQLSFIDPWMIKGIQTDPANVLIPTTMILKGRPGIPEQRLEIVKTNPDTGKLEGEVFFFGINQLPNSIRGRSDLLPLADWLDMYDQYMFGEVERLTLLSSFVWNYTITGGTDKDIQEKLARFNKPRPGQVFAHNEKETLSAETPDLKAADRSEVAKMLRTHIAGAMGYPVSYLGDIDSNRATIEGQNDVMLKTPAARQKEFGAFIDQIVRYSLEHAQDANQALFRDVTDGYQIVMPEISAKDISRVGSVVAQVMSGMDTALANATISRRAAVAVQLAVIKHLGISLDPNEVMAEADEEEAERKERADEMAANIAAGRALNQNNPPVGGDDDDDEGDDGGNNNGNRSRESLEAIKAAVDRLASRPIQVSAPVTIAPRNVERKVKRDPQTGLIDSIIEQDAKA